MITQQEQQAIEKAGREYADGMWDKTEVKAAFEAGAKALDEMRKPSEDLKQELLSMFDSNFDGYLFDDSDNGEPCLSHNKFVDIIPKIAQLIPSCQSQQNVVNMELLEACKD